MTTSGGNILGDSEQESDCYFFDDEEEENDCYFLDEIDDNDIYFLNDVIYPSQNENKNDVNNLNHEDICCEKQCFNQLSRHDVQNAKIDFPRNNSEQNNWIMNYISKFSEKKMSLRNKKLVEEIDTNFCIAGKKVCEQSWRKIYGISSYRLFKAKERYANGHNLFIHGNSGRFKLSHNSSECVGWLLNFLNLIGEHLPNEDVVELPAGMTKKDVFQKMDKELLHPPPIKTKYRLWQKFCSNVKTTKGSGFSKCHYCISLLTALEKAKLQHDEASIELIQEKRHEHWNDIRKRVSKEIQNRTVPPIKTYLTGALVHRQDQNAYQKVGYSFFDFTQYIHDVNLNISILMEILKDFKDSLGREFHLQMDSASNNKNGYMIGFCGMLVHRKIFKEVYLHMLPVRHTHEDVDAMFHNIADVLKVDVITFKDLLLHISNIGFMKGVKSVGKVWDIKKWLERSMVGSHSFNDCFHIRIHNSKGKIVWHYKKWSSGKWLPDPEDPSTYLQEKDNNGIEIFKVKLSSFGVFVEGNASLREDDIVQTWCMSQPPQDEPVIIEPTWTNDQRDQIEFTKRKLIGSGLLSEQEKEWWEKLTVESLPEPTTEITEFPLDVLPQFKEKTGIIPSEINDLHDLQERVNVVYSGKYIPPAKRRMMSRMSDNILEEQCTETEYRFPITTRSGRKATTLLL